MGRIFETRKHKIYARMDKMAKAFTKVGKEVAIAVKEGGADPNNNARLRAAIQNAKGVNMPKDRVDAAIKRAISKDASNYEELTYEGYGPHGVAIIVDCATDNTTRTVANVRMHFSKGNGNLGTNSSVQFLFDRKGVFKIAKQGVNLEELELDLIDFGAEDIQEDENEIYIYTRFADFGSMQKGLEAKGIVPISSEKQWIPLSTKEVTDAEADDVMKLIGMLEDDDDVLAVYHTMA
ncbi:MAG: YebC/PmpR family DNA-binding transcriptional regulator [Chitinophagales bacterium]|jgi:YebC/PmpR family DNA-binding regulatory protein|nr:YebC/PmpR family DNA-binding transcriptional regulator [Chitinophagaceae bacterium]MBP9884405.1 YebC/PmpR family DNA-binding transcriptional regulator [Chitinophagales bacterium]